MSLSVSVCTNILHLFNKKIFIELRWLEHGKIIALYLSRGWEGLLTTNFHRVITVAQIYIYKLNDIGQSNPIV